MSIQSNGISIFRALTVNDIILIVLILLLGWLLVKLIRQLFPWIADRFSGKRRLYILALMPIIRLAVIFGLIIILVPLILVPSTENLVALLGALGIAIGLGSKEYVSSLLAGIVTLYEMPYQPGDWIEINGIYGEVKSIGLRSLELLTPDDTIVRIPQMKIWDSPVFNSTAGNRELLCVTDYYLHPKHDAVKVKQALRDVALTSPYTQYKLPIEVVVSEKPWGTNYRLKAYPVDAREQFRFMSDLTIRGKQALMELDVEFATVPNLPSS